MLIGIGHLPFSLPWINTKRPAEMLSFIELITVSISSNAISFIEVTNTGNHVSPARVIYRDRGFGSGLQNGFWNYKIYWPWFGNLFLHYTWMITTKIAVGSISINKQINER
jgi:hypothetical protein